MAGTPRISSGPPARSPLEMAGSSPRAPQRVIVINACGVVRMNHRCVACCEPLSLTEPVVHAVREVPERADCGDSSEDVLFHPHHFPVGSAVYKIRRRLTTLAATLILLEEGLL